MRPQENQAVGGAAEVLSRLLEIAREAGLPALAEEARALSDRIAAGLFYVACVGQFKRGKSTLVNALVGRTVLPTGVVPVTAVPTVLRDGDLGARVWLREEGWREIPLEHLVEYVTEERNPGNGKGVLGAEVRLRAPLLEKGCCLVDTPGLGSVFEATSTAAKAFVPQIDAAIVVIGADPPISGDELKLAAEVAHSVVDLIFVLNKVDRVPSSERREVLAFTEKVLRERLGNPVSQLFEVSSLNALRREGHAGEWQTFVAALERLPAQRGRLVAAAASRGITRLAIRLERVLQQQRQALLRPVEQSEERVRELRELAAGTGQALAEMGPLLTGEQQRLRRRFEERRQTFLDRTGPAARAELEHRLTTLSSRGRVDRAAAFETASAVAQELVRPWLAEAESDAEQAYREATRRFAEYAGGALIRLARVAGVDSSTLVLDSPPEGIRGRRGFYWHDLLHRHDPPRPWRRWADRLLPPRASRRRVGAAAAGYLADLLFVNALRVEGDLNDRVQESRRALEADLTAILRELMESAAEGLERARRTQQAGAEAVCAAVAGLDQRLCVVEGIMAAHRPIATAR